jgi:hypothetical protein
VSSTTPPPVAYGHNTRVESRGGKRKMALHRMRLDTPLASLVGDDDENEFGAPPLLHVPNYRLQDVDGGRDALTPGALAKWPARQGTPTLLVHATKDGGSALMRPRVDTATTTPAFLAHVSRYLAFELPHVPPSEGTVGRLKVCREALAMVIDTFPSYAPVLETIRQHYDERIEALEEEMARFVAAEGLVQIERERYIEARDQAKNTVASERATAERERGRAFAVDRRAKDREAELQAKIGVLEGEVELAHRQALQERAARREADDNAATYARMYHELKSQWDAAKAEVGQFRSEAKQTLLELEREKRVAESTLALLHKKHAMEKQEWEAALEHQRATSLTPAQADEMHAAAAKLRKDVRNMQMKVEWMNRELEKRAKYEPPINWLQMDRPELHKLVHAGVTSHDLVTRVLYDHDRAKKAEQALRERLEALASVASAVECGPLIAALPAFADHHLHGGGGGGPVSDPHLDELVKTTAIEPLTAHTAPWAPKSWLLCDVSPDGPLSTLPPSVHQHRAIRQWACAALVTSAVTCQGSLCLALEKVCSDHFDFRTTGPFFNTVVYRLRTTFAGDPFLRFFASLLIGRRSSLAHGHQLLLQVRAALQALEHVDRSLCGKLTGKLPKEAVLAALPSAFPLKTGAQLVAIRQALFEQLDGRMTAGGFVGPDGSINVLLPPAIEVSAASSPSARNVAFDEGNSVISRNQSVGFGASTTAPTEAPLLSFDTQAAGNSLGVSATDTKLSPDTSVNASALAPAVLNHSLTGTGVGAGTSTYQTLPPTPWHAIAI